MQHNFSLISAKYPYNPSNEKIVIQKVQARVHSIITFLDVWIDYLFSAGCRL